jgi:NADPH2:quinone reductase
MRALVIDRLMEPSEVRVGALPVPEPGEGEVLVRVEAAACNFSDILLLQGRYQEKPAHPFVLGREMAGVVVGRGRSAQRFRQGNRVLAATGLGAFAEYVAIPERLAHPLPESMSFEAGAALPIVYPTSYAALVDRAAVQPGEVVLVHAAAGGVGLAAVQIAKALGARVIATAGGPEKLEIARQAGADIGVDYKREDFVEAVEAATDGAGADVIYDSVGGDTFDRSLRCIAWNGRLVVVGFASGRIPEVAANRILLKNIAVTGIHWPAYAEHDPGRVDAVFAELFALAEGGGIAPLIGARYALDEAGVALGELASRRSVGKIVLIP